MDDDRLAARGRQRRTGAGERLDEIHVAGQRIRPGDPHFADDEYLLALVGLDGDGDLRVVEEAVVLQLLLHLQFDVAQA